MRRVLLTATAEAQLPHQIWEAGAQQVAPASSPSLGRGEAARARGRDRETQDGTCRVTVLCQTLGRVLCLPDTCLVLKLDMEKWELGGNKPVTRVMWLVDG